MKQRKAWVWLLAAVCSGCVSVDYVGKTLPPTTNVDLYMSAADVGRPYQVIGNASAQVEAMPFMDPSQQLQDKLLEEARKRGADAVILGHVDSREVQTTQQTFGQADTKKKSGGKKKTHYTETTTTNTEEIKSLRGTLIKYTAP